jgi:glycosyltransferase 2 family protein
MTPGAKVGAVARRAFKVLFFPAVLLLAGFLIYRISRQYELDEVVQAVGAIPVSRLLLAVGFAALSYLCLTGFDWLAVRYVGRPLPWRKTALASFSALSIGHNIGIAALSSGAIRYRFYSRWGLSGAECIKVILFCGLTVGLGLMILGGLALLLSPGLASEYTRAPRTVVLLVGSLCLGLAAAYLVVSIFDWRPVRIGKYSLQVPPFHLALGQAVIGPLNFAMVAACLYQGIAAVREVSYLAVASSYVIANVTAMLSHVPGGLGVIESVILFLMGGGPVIGAVLVFRVVYFFVPLAIGGSVFVLIEFGLLVRSRRANQQRS